MLYGDVIGSWWGGGYVIEMQLLLSSKTLQYIYGFGR